MRTYLDCKNIVGNIPFTMTTKTHQSALRIVQRTSFNKFLAQYGHLQQTALLKMWMKHLFVTSSASKELTALKEFFVEKLQIIHKNHNGVQLTGCCELRVVFAFEFLKGHKKSDIIKGAIHKGTKPDLDNLAKVFMDCIEKVGMVENDSRFSKIILEKSYCHIPGIYFSINELTEEPIGYGQQHDSLYYDLFCIKEYNTWNKLMSEKANKSKGVNHG